VRAHSVRKHAFDKAVNATMIDLDRFGMTFLVNLPDGKRRARVNFPEPVSTAGDEVQKAIVGAFCFPRGL